MTTPPDPASIDWNSIALWAGGVATVLTSIGVAIWAAVNRATKVAAGIPPTSELHRTDVYTTDSVALHELTHWTGAGHRLARDFSGRFGTEAYAFEELIAELGSAFLNADLGFSAATIPNHAGYIESWLKVLKHDKRAIFTAASAASKAHRYILDRVEGRDEQMVA